MLTVVSRDENVVFDFEDDHEFLHIKSSSGLSPMAGNPADVNFEFQKSNFSVRVGLDCSKQKNQKQSSFGSR